MRFHKSANTIDLDKQSQHFCLENLLNFTDLTFVSWNCVYYFQIEIFGLFLSQKKSFCWQSGNKYFVKKGNKERKKDDKGIISRPRDSTKNRKKKQRK